MKGATILRSRFLRGVVVGVGVSVAVVGSLVGAAWWKATSAECAELKREDLSIDEMVAIKEKVDDYRRDATHPLDLSAREASFLVREHLRLQAWLGVEGDRVDLDLRIPESRHCYDVTFQGSVEVVDGVARVVPSNLVVGTLDLTWWAGGTAYEIRSGQVGEEAAANLLEHVTLLQVAGGRIALQVDDPEVLR